MPQQITPYRNDTEGKTAQVARMFDSIANTYDFLNHFLSAGIDILWRRKAILELKEKQPASILDIATGTGDLAFEAIRELRPLKITGIDISEGMLAIAKQKREKRKLTAVLELLIADSENLPFEDNTFDAATVSFGVRNFENLEKGLSEIYRVLNTSGKLVVLEFSKPAKFPVKQLYAFYFFTILPFIGWFFSGDSNAYNYLPRSVAAFPDGKDFLEKLENAGFAKVKWRSLGFGICAIYSGIK